MRSSAVLRLSVYLVATATLAACAPSAPGSPEELKALAQQVQQQAPQTVYAAKQRLETLGAAVQEGAATTANVLTHVGEQTQKAVAATTGTLESVGQVVLDATAPGPAASTPTSGTR